MRAIVLAGLVVLSGCDWDAAQTQALCTRSGTCDAGIIDAGTVDAGAIDAGSVDSGTPDSGLVDAGLLDAGAADAGAADAGAPDAGRRDIVLTAAGTAFGVTFDGEDTWSVVQTSTTGTAVFRGARSVFSSGMAPAALYGNEEVDSGVLLGLSTQLVMLDRDGGTTGMMPAAPAPKLVSLFVSGVPLASMWADSSNTYNQQVFNVPSLTTFATPGSQGCTTLTLHDVEVLNSSVGGSAVITYEASGCPSNGATMGVLTSPPPGVQLITPTGTRSGFSAAHAGRTMVGRTTRGFDLASRSTLTITVSHHSPLGMTLGNVDTISASDVLELGDTMFGYVLVVAQGTVARNMNQVGVYGARTALLIPLDSSEPVIQLGPAATSGRLGLWAGPTLVAALWDDAIGNVTLTRITR